MQNGELNTLCYSGISSGYQQLVRRPSRIMNQLDRIQWMQSSEQHSDSDRVCHIQKEIPACIAKFGFAMNDNHLKMNQFDKSIWSIQSFETSLVIPNGKPSRLQTKPWIHFSRVSNFELKREDVISLCPRDCKKF